MNGSERIRSASLRSRRAYHGHRRRARRRSPPCSGPMPRPTVTAIARISGGNARIASIARIATPSRRRRPCPRAARSGRRSARRRRSRCSPTSSEMRAPSAKRGEHVAAELVGAHRVRRRRALQRVDQVLRVGPVLPQDRREDREQHEQHDHAERDGDAPVGEDRARGAPWRARRRRRRTARPAPADVAQGPRQRRGSAARSSCARSVLPFDLQVPRSVYYRRSSTGRPSATGARESALVRHAVQDWPSS